MSAFVGLDGLWALTQARAAGDAEPVRVASIAAEDLVEAARGLVARGWLLVGLFAAKEGEAEEASDGEDRMRVRYVWTARGTPWLVLEVEAPEDPMPSIAAVAFAADWPEREAEDLFGLHLAGHPRLGDFILHDEDWGEGLAPMRSGFAERLANATPAGDGYRPTRILDASGGFLMPVGPVFSGEQEAMQVLVETVGEEIIDAHVRLFYKYRAIERAMEGRLPADALFLAERVNGPQALAHGLAFCQAVEQLCGARVPARARAVRTILAEHERARLHVRALSGLVESTGLSVPRSLLDTCQERLLQAAGEIAGHRYLFGVLRPGGLATDMPDEALTDLTARTRAEVAHAAAICDSLASDSSFLDRVEAVGTLSPERTATLGLVGPIARAAGIANDLRVWQPYAAYAGLDLSPVVESEGDGYARMRVWRREAEAAVAIMTRLTAELPPGPVLQPAEVGEGVGLNGVEAPSGLLAYWLRTDAGGRVARCHIMTPGFANFHGLTDALRDFSFQDLPIILASFGLSVADADR